MVYICYNNVDNIENMLNENIHIKAILIWNSKMGKFSEDKIILKLLWGWELDKRLSDCFFWRWEKFDWDDVWI